jgi:ABC-2 type transport system permease protein
MEVKRQVMDPLVLIFTLLLVPVMVLIFGLTMSDNYGWSEDYTIFDIMMPGFLTYACLLTIYDAAASVTGERELGLQKRLYTTPLTSGEYIASQMVSYTIKPILQLLLALVIAYLVGFRPVNGFLGYILIIIFLVVLTFCSVGFGMITSTFSKTASAAGGFAFIFIVPQQIFATFIPPEFIGANSFKWVFPSFYATDAIGKIFAGNSLTDTVIWARLGILLVLSAAIYLLGLYAYEQMRKR